MKSRQQHSHPAPGYLSDFDQFMDAFLEQHPEVLEDRQRGWYIWWDHRLDLDELDKQRDSTVPVKANHYP